MEFVSEFENKKYVHLKEFLDKSNCDELTKELKSEIQSYGWNDAQCPKSKSIRNSPTFDKLLVDLLPYFELVSGLKLLPTYAYARLYEPGEVLKIHSDREACEISATLTLGFDGDVWPIYMGTLSETKTPTTKIDEIGNEVNVSDVAKIDMEIGDAVLYKGCELQHWRDEYKEGKWQAQVFLHYVDADGPNKEWKYDKRKSLNLFTNKTDDLTYWSYDDILTDKDCDMLVKLYNTAPDEVAGIGSNNNTVDKNIRNVNKVILPIHKGIGARLAAAGFDANAQRWKFDVKRANQAEFLKYPTGGGRYKGHLDTFLSNDLKNIEECRKLTVLAFLNDDFKGGKFFLQTGHNKFYPPQEKGTVLVFPSFLLHGVEDVEEGERFSAVCWLVGPWFK